MGRTEYPIDEIVKLYRDSHVPAAEIGRRLGISRNRVRAILENAGIPRDRSAQSLARIDKSVLKELYLVSRLPLKEIGNRFGTTEEMVKRALRNCGIAHRRSRSLMELEALQVGEHIDYPSGAEKKPHGRFHNKGYLTGMRFSVRRGSGGKWRVTRVG